MYRVGLLYFNGYFLLYSVRDRVENRNFHCVGYSFLYRYWNFLLYWVWCWYWNFNGVRFGFFYWVRNRAINFYFDWYWNWFEHWVGNFLLHVIGYWFRDVDWVGPVYVDFHWYWYFLVDWVRFRDMNWNFDWVANLFFDWVWSWYVHFVGNVDSFFYWVGLRYQDFYWIRLIHVNLDGNVLNFLYWYWFVNGYFNVHWYFNRVRNLLLHWVGLWNMYFYRVGYLLLDWHVNNLLYRVRY